MHRVKVYIAMLAAGTLALGSGVALAADEASKAPVGTNAPATSKMPGGSKAAATHAAAQATIHRVRGEVTAVEPTARTLVVKVMEGKKELTVGVDVTDKTIIREAKTHKTLADIKVGDRVWMKYERTNDKLVAEAIHILKPRHVAAKK